MGSRERLYGGRNDFQYSEGGELQIIIIIMNRPANVKVCKAKVKCEGAGS